MLLRTFCTKVFLFWYILRQIFEYTYYMIESIQNFFSNIGGSFLAVLLISMIPVCEARIGLPFGMAKEIWGAEALSPLMSFVASFLGSSLIALVILICLKPIFARLKKTKTFENLISSLESKFKKQSIELDDKEAKKHKTFNRWLGIMLFVAIPAPMTGIWTGSGIACFTSLNLWQSFSAIAVGNLFACVLVLFVCTIFKDSIIFLLIASSIMLVISLGIYFLSKKRKKSPEQSKLA